MCVNVITMIFFQNIITGSLKKIKIFCSPFHLKCNAVSEIAGAFLDIIVKNHMKINETLLPLKTQ